MEHEGRAGKRLGCLLLALALLVGFAGCIGGEGETPPDEEDGPTTLDEEEDGADEGADSGQDGEDSGEEDQEEGSEDEARAQPETVEEPFRYNGTTPLFVYASADGSGYGFAIIPPFAEGNETFHDESLQGVTELEFEVSWDEPVDAIVNVTLLSDTADTQSHHFESPAPISAAIDVPDPYDTFEITVSTITQVGDPMLGAGLGPSVEFQLTGTATVIDA